MLARAVRDLDPGYFALVMATGICSIAALMQGWNAVSVGLMWVAGVAYLLLAAANLTRMAVYRSEFAADLTTRRPFGFFTFVAAGAVVGTRVVADGHLVVAFTLLVVSGGAWLVLGYLLPALMFGGEKPPVTRADGSWFIWAVATASVTVLAASVQPHLHGHLADDTATLAVFCWAVAVAVYCAVVVFVASRLLSSRPEPRDVTGAYWVAMGATAIIVVAGTAVVAMNDSPILRVTGGTVAAMIVLFWSFGTWLIPPLVFAGYWRHVIRGVPLRYEVALWSIVFPLGMYGVASRRLGSGRDIPIIDTVGHVEIWVALTAWIIVFVMMIISLVQAARAHRSA